MSTNYYLIEPTPVGSGKSDGPLHIGKSSVGWCFSLHVIPELNLLSLKEWEARWNARGAVIENERGESVSPSEMKDCITNRPYPRELQRNSLTPNVTHGRGSYDYVKGDFS